MCSRRPLVDCTGSPARVCHELQDLMRGVFGVLGGARQRAGGERVRAGAGLSRTHV